MSSFKRWIHERKKTGRGKVLLAIIAIPLGLAAVSGIFALIGHIIKWLWNATVTTIFETTPITFWQAVMIFALCKFLFSNTVNVKQTKEDPKKGLCDEPEEGVGNADSIHVEASE